MFSRDTITIVRRAVAIVPWAALLAGCLEAVAPSPEQAEQIEQLGERLPDARLLWTRGDKIYHSAIDPFEPQRLTEGNVEETWPRWSPDGSMIAFCRGMDVWVMKEDFTEARQVIPLARWPAWADDGEVITAVAADRYRVLRHDLATAETTTIYDAREPPYNGQQIWRMAELRPGGRFLLLFRLEPEHATEIVDLERQVYLSNAQMMQGDCQPAWAPDGSYVVATANTETRPIRKALFDETVPELEPSTYFVGLNTPYVYQHHGERISSDGRWIAFFSEFFAGPEAGSGSEIYLWEIGTTDLDVVRMTFNREDDNYPSLRVGSATGR